MVGTRESKESLLWLIDTLSSMGSGDPASHGMPIQHPLTPIQTSVRMANTMPSDALKPYSRTMSR
jgi:hypothetical protein